MTRVEPAPGFSDELPRTRRALDSVFGAHLQEAGARTVAASASMTLLILVLQVVGLVVTAVDGDVGDVVGGLVGCAVFWTILIVSLRGTA